MTTLPYKVECRWPAKAYYDLVAAFDCESAATGYAGECALNHPTFFYRVKRGRTIVSEG